MWGREQYGSDAVHGALADFCGRWQYGVEVLLDDAEGIREALDRAASAYQATDEGMGDLLQSGSKNKDFQRQIDDIQGGG